MDANLTSRLVTKEVVALQARPHSRPSPDKRCYRKVENYYLALGTATSLDLASKLNTRFWQHPTVNLRISAVTIPSIGISNMYAIDGSDTEGLSRRPESSKSLETDTLPDRIA